MLSEADASLELLAHTSFAVSEPVAIGEPGAGYPLPWFIQTRVPGTTASQEDASTSVDFAHDLARSASNRASTYSTFPGYVGFGHGYGKYRGSRPRA